jgi:hypothetical protein
MQWNLENLSVTGRYLNMYTVTGTVELSRVTYGGRVTHHVVLNKPITVFGAVRERIILDHEQIESISEGVAV